jgi:hypothetical protein
MTDDEPDLSEYGIGRPDPPHFVPQEQVYSTQGPGGRQEAGTIGYVPEREQKAFLKNGSELLRARDAYCISNDALAHVVKTGIAIVFVAEEDSKDVYEYDIEAFTQRGFDVPDKFRQHPDDRQTGSQRSRASFVWLDHDDEFYVTGEPNHSEKGRERPLTPTELEQDFLDHRAEKIAHETGLRVEKVVQLIDNHRRLGDFVEALRKCRDASLDYNDLGPEGVETVLHGEQ